jgi:mannose-1-phosphate guanylyltransferase
MLVSLLEIARRDPAATVAVFPSDHDVRNAAAFRRHVGAMVELVAHSTPALRVVAFHEKPTAARAAGLVRAGALWNSFVMVGRVAHMLELLGRVRPADCAALRELPLDPEALAPAYDRLPAWNFSRDFLARVPEHLLVVPAADVGWSDWGTPEAIERTVEAMGLALARPPPGHRLR